MRLESAFRSSIHPRLTLAAAAVALAIGAAHHASATVISNQVPVSGGGIARWSQLWQDPGPNGNDLDGDSVCWEDFTLAAPTAIDHIEWWGAGACELGFRIQFWKQDPGTIAYQPIGVFYYGGDHTVHPQATFNTTSFITTPGPGGINHYVLDLASPINLAANDAANPRWFIAIIGLTHQAYYTWNWAQGTGGSTRTYQFIRGSGPQFRQLSEGRALLLASGSCAAPGIDAQPLPTTTCPAGSAAFSVSASGTASLAYQWQRESTPGTFVNLADGPITWDGSNPRVGGTVSGAATPMLIIDAGSTLGKVLSAAHATRYRCVVTNSCGTITTDPADLAVCIADIDDGSGSGACDGGVTIDDLLFYLGIFSAGDVRADVDDGSAANNPDGGVTIDDLLYFLTRFAAGC